MFKLTSQEIGVVRPNKVVFIEYPYEGELTFTKAESPCGCSIPQFDMINKKIIIKYTPGEMPIHLKAQGKSQLGVTKWITVYYTIPEAPGEEQQTVLEFTATIKL